MSMMASSSSSRCNYDVFLSFRGNDTRFNFTGHLCNALRSREINTFIHNDLQRGEEITTLLAKIEESKISVIVFSKNHASSPWCLDELVKILECKRNYGQIVLPVFYDVDPSEVEQQSGCLADCLQMNLRDQFEKMESWRAGLKFASSLPGWNSRDFRCEAKLVSVIAEHLTKVVKAPGQWVPHVRGIKLLLSIWNSHVPAYSNFGFIKYIFFLNNFCHAIDISLAYN